MRISQFFNLGKSQAVLDFVDVDVVNDIPIFVSPRALRLLPSEWGNECVSLIQDFFNTVLTGIRTGRNDDAERLLRTLREPNETRLGLSRGRAQGRALGTSSAHDVWQALSNSEAAKSGLIEDLEDTVLMVDGISDDIVSDMATNIIRAPLIRYTQLMCEWHEIPLGDVDSGPLWNPRAHQWENRFDRLPIINNQKLLLVPKSIVRRHSDYSVSEYYNHYLLEHLQDVELNANSALVELLRDGNRRVTKKALKAKYGGGKSMIVRETLRFPEVLERYRADKDIDITQPLTHEQLADIQEISAPDWDLLLRAVTDTAVGQLHATQYEKAIEGLLTALFYPVLTNPIIQHKIHEGRKRIDITYTNMASRGFFEWLATHFPAAHVFVECKNYGNEIANPEIDQLSSRFSPTRGTVGMLVCRSVNNVDLLMRRCRDTAVDHRGFILPLEDRDLAALVEERRRGGNFFELAALRTRFQQLVS